MNSPITRPPKTEWTPTFIKVPWVNEYPVDYKMLKNRP